MPIPLDSLDLRIFAVALPITIALVQLLKQAFVPGRWAGLAAVATGVGTALVLHAAGIGSGPPALAAVTGVVAGLSAAGAWSGAKALRDSGQ
jgi:hypothetical protein